MFKKVWHKISQGEVNIQPWGQLTQDVHQRSGQRCPGLDTCTTMWSKHINFKIECFSLEIETKSSIASWASASSWNCTLMQLEFSLSTLTLTSYGVYVSNPNMSRYTCILGTGLT